MTVHRFNVQVFGRFSPQMNDQADSHCLINSLLLHTINQNHALHWKSPMIKMTRMLKKRKLCHSNSTQNNASTQTEIDTSRRPDASPEHVLSKSHEIFIFPENFSNQSVTHCSSLKIDDDVEFPWVNNDLLHVNHAHTDYLSSYTATHPRQDLSRIMKSLFQDPTQFLFMIPHPHWHFSQKNKPARKYLAQCFINLPLTNMLIPTTNPSTCIPKGYLWWIMNKYFENFTKFKQYSSINVHLSFGKNFISFWNKITPSLAFFGSVAF